MKKFFTAIIAILYLGTSIGATINMHYCMGKLVEWGLWHTKNEKCSNCGMEKGSNLSTNGCCKDEYKQIKLDKDQKIVQNSIQPIFFSVITLIPAFISYHDVVISSLSEKYPNNNAPPRSQLHSLFLLHCVFRI